MSKPLKVFEAVDEKQLRILNLLFQGELCGCDIQHVLEAFPQSNVTRRLIYSKNVGW